MNLGIQDGIALADALTIALNSGDEHVLLEYEAQRRPIARDVIMMADRLTRLATVPRALRAVRNFMLRTIARAPAIRRRLAMNLSGLAISPAAVPSRRAPVWPRPPVQSSHSHSPAV
jgi:2-polyprenyl-6-methoxyphenol hydroxylase-like FAD-dependent oxidoreductase